MTQFSADFLGNILATVVIKGLFLPSHDLLNLRLQRMRSNGQAFKSAKSADKNLE